MRASAEGNYIARPDVQTNLGIRYTLHHTTFLHRNEMLRKDFIDFIKQTPQEEHELNKIYCDKVKFAH